MKSLLSIFFATICVLTTQASLFGQMSSGEKDEIATMDAVFTMMGSLDSLINNDPEKAAKAIRLQKRLLEYSTQKTQQFASVGATENLYGARYRQRMKQNEAGRESWDSSIERFLRNSDSRFDSALKRVEREIEKIRNPKKSRTGKTRKPNFGMIASMGRNSMQQAGGTFVVLDALGKATDEQRERYEAAFKELISIETEFEAEIAEKVRVPRDAYRTDDRDSIEAFVREHMSKAKNDLEVAKIIIPSTNWKGFYGATWDEDTKRIQKRDIEKLDVLVLAKKSEELVLMIPVRVQRNRSGQDYSIVDSPDRPQCVLASKVK